MDDICCNLIKLIDRPEIRTEMGRNAKSATNVYDIGKTHILLLEIYQDLVEARNRRIK